MRRTSLAILVLVSVPVFVIAQSQPPRPTVVVYKKSTCGCCAKWVTHLRQHGFEVTSTDVADLGVIKARHNVPPGLSTCHTALVKGYVVEGHVPAEDVVLLLKDRPAVAGIAVPGMPIGSPGMEGGNPQAYDVVSFDKKGEVKIFSSHRP